MKRYIFLVLSLVILSSCSMGSGTEGGVERLVGSKWISDDCLDSSYGVITAISFDEGTVTLSNERTMESGTYDGEKLYVSGREIFYSTDYERTLTIIDGDTDYIFIIDRN